MRTIRPRFGSFAAALLVVLGMAGGAHGFEFFDGRLQVHGFYESQIRGMARDFDTGDNVDLTQWYNILNLEIEGDIAPDGIGPLELIEAYMRVEVRYDCVWTRACGMFPSANVYGDRAKKIPKRLGGGRRAGYRSSGAVYNADQRQFQGISRDELGFDFSRRDPAAPNDPALSFYFPPAPVGTTDGKLLPPPPNGSYTPSPLFDIQGLDTLFNTLGEDQIFGTQDDAAPFYFSDQLDCRFNFRKTGGSQNGVGSQVLGPWNPKCKSDPLAALSGKPNPLSSIDGQAARNGIPGSTGFGALPLRPAPTVQATDTLTGAPLEGGSRNRAKGVYYPNSRLAQLITENDFGSFDQNYRQAELEWNRGASQQDEKELKEAYLDIEMLDNRLWLRLGKQQIVWGKTELFRNQDQWNPQDLALASLPSLEESRIALWAARAVFSFYEVGPLEDVRLELAMLYDQFEPVDLGRCGEPYAPNPVCNKTLGLWVHGLTGYGIAGEIRPQDPWNSASGTEVGARLEWRWGRFSMALTDYYGYTDFPYAETTFIYSRNVDPVTGRPRRDMATGDCDSNVFGYLPGPASADPDCLTPTNALTNHSVNQQTFSVICSTSIGLSTLDTSACGQTVFNSLEDPIISMGTPPDTVNFPTIASLVGNLLAGNATAKAVGSNPALGGVAFPGTLVSLSVDPCDGLLSDCLTQANGAGQIDQPSNFFGAGAVPSINTVLTSQQKALLGCGEFYGTNCELQGFDLMNAEASVLMQSFPGIEGSFGVYDVLWDTEDVGVAQPGTLDFARGPVGTRGDVILPGAAGGNDPSTPFDNDPGYDPILDGCSGPEVFPGGCIAGDAVLVGSPADLFVPPGSFTGVADGLRDADAPALIHPLTGQPFRSEMAALSWNFLMTLVAFSLPLDADDNGIPDIITIVDYDQTRPFRTDGCSLARPNLCGNVQSFFQITGVQRNTVRAGGRNGHGRRDFSWHGGRELALRYKKRNILGFSMDFAEDITKSNWSMEFTWQNDLVFTDNNDISGNKTGVDTYNMTISVDRPTFVNFLNQGRTLFINTQWFIQYVDGYSQGFTSNGPWNFLGVFAVQTGYFDDRLLPQLTLVYDVGSNSGAVIPQVSYRFTANFSATFGLALFSGREQFRDMPISPVSLSNRVGRHAYKDVVENGLSAIRDRDEAFLRIRYAF